MTTVASTPSAQWWHDAVIYEIYVASFTDTNGDGIGDLPGALRRLDYLADLGVDALWLTPFFPSPGKDHGYDVADYCSVARHLGDLDVFRQLVDAAHDRSIRVLIDQVPNHTSDQHRWFQAALADPDGPYRQYYMWRDSAPDGGPPNNWISTFGGSAWAFEPASRQYYLHLYLPEQPDLNWSNPAVYDEWVQIFDFWLAAGVDGFRIDVAHALVKHPDLPDNPPADPLAQPSVLSRVAQARTLQRRYDIDQDDVLPIYRRLRKELPLTAAGVEPVLLGETVLDSAPRVDRYLAPGEGLSSAMWFGAMLVPWSAKAVEAALSALAPTGGGSPAWFLSNHDGPRPASRLGGGRIGADRALALAALYLAMPGPYLLYQGEELGQEDLVLSRGESVDPVAVRTGEMAAARDCARAPVPWTSNTDQGFGSDHPWLPHGPLPVSGAADAQALDPTSHLSRWRTVLARWKLLRNGLPATVVVSRSDDVVVVRRGALAVATNLGEHDCDLVDAGLDREWPIVWRSVPDAAAARTVVREGETVWCLSTRGEGDDATIGSVIRSTHEHADFPDVNGAPHDE